MKKLWEAIRMLMTVYLLGWASDVSPKTEEGIIVNKYIASCMLELLKTTKKMQSNN